MSGRRRVFLPLPPAELMTLRSQRTLNLALPLAFAGAVTLLRAAILLTVLAAGGVLMLGALGMLRRGQYTRAAGITAAALTLPSSNTATK